MLVHVVGAGLAGCECALQLAARGIDVWLYEMKPREFSAAHANADLAELVCSNSFKSKKLSSAAGLLKWELAQMGSFLLDFAECASVEAGMALAVDREQFSRLVTQAIESNKHIELVHERVDHLIDGEACVVATGPLCSEALFASLGEQLGQDSLSFYDAAAPIVEAETIDFDQAFSQSRYQDGPGDYLNCPLSKEEYEHFYEELISAKRAVGHEISRKELFQACQPIEYIADSGKDALRFGTMKPRGLTDPRTGKRPWAVVQLRAENKEKTAYNLVGFQTSLAWGEQKRVFSLIPALSQAEFLRYGVIHRNSFVDSPHVLEANFKIPSTSIWLAGQITGTEGYTEAIASGLLAALSVFTEIRELDPVVLPQETLFGALVHYATNPKTEKYQPMHVNFGLLPPLEEPCKNKKLRYGKFAQRAQSALTKYLITREDLECRPLENYQGIQE